MTRCFSLRLSAIAYSAVTVFPAEVCADTSTLSLFSMHRMASSWNGSSWNLYVFAGALVGFLSGFSS